MFNRQMPNKIAFERFAIRGAQLLLAWYVFSIAYVGVDDAIHDLLENNNHRSQFIIYPPPLYLQSVTTYLPAAAFVLLTWSVIARTSYWTFTRLALLLVICAEWAYLGSGLPTKLNKTMWESQFKPGGPNYFYHLQPSDYVGALVLGVMATTIVILATFAYQKWQLRRSTVAPTTEL